MSRGSGSGSALMLPPKHSLPRLVFRFVSGRPMDGRRRTDAQFWLPATKSVDGQQRPTRWSMRPGWYRAAWRLGSLTAAVAAAWATATGHGAAVRAAVAAAVAVTAAVVGLRSWRAARLWRHRREWVTPLHRALARPLDLPPNTSPSYLDVPVGLHKSPGARVKISVPADFAGAEPGARRIVEDTIAAKLALDDPEYSWRLAGPAPVLLVRQAPQPPVQVTITDIRSALDSAKESAPILGLGVRGLPQSVDFDSESPHVLLSMAPGGGKSVTSRLVASQVLARGGLLVILDLKRVSHLWARGLPGVAYCRDIHDIHDAIIAVATEGARRFRLIEEEGEQAVLDLPRILVIAEEMNATMGKLRNYWTNTRQSSDPKISPALDAFNDGLFLGRQARANYMAIGQLMTARAIGGPEARENFSTRILSRYSMNAARMLAPEVKMPPASRVTGRAQVYRGGEVHATQIAFLTENDARELVADGHQSLGLDLPVGAGVSELLGTMAPPIGRHNGLHVVQANRPAITAGDDLVGLAAACATGGVLGQLGVSLDAARKARTRDPEFPAAAGARGQEQLYRPSALSRWERNRPRSSSSTEAG